MDGLKSQIMDARIDELAARDKILDGLRTLALGQRTTRQFCEKELGYTVSEARVVLAQLGLILTSESLVSSDLDVQVRIDKLRQWRRERAGRDGVPAYRVLTNRELLKVASEIPKTVEELRDLKGFGMKRTDLFGEEIMTLLKS